MFLLDTNVISELRVRSNIHKNVVAWAKSVDSSDMYVSAITILELEKGICAKEQSRKLGDQQFGKILRQWMDRRVLPEFKHRILPIDASIAVNCAKMHVPDARKLGDSLIAATALEHDMTVITRDFKDFKSLGVKLVNPFEYQG